MVVLACFSLVGLAVRLLLHAGDAWAGRGLGPDPDPDLPRSAVIAYTDPVLRVAAGAAGAASVLALAYLSGTGPTSPGG